MSEVTDKATNVLLGLIQKASDGVDSAVAFSQAQIPDVVNQLLLWNAMSSAIICMVCVILIIPCVYWSIKAFGGNVADGDSDAAFLIVTFSSIVVSVSIFTMVLNFDWLKILIAPKLYLLEYAAALIK